MPVIESVPIERPLGGLLLYSERLALGLCKKALLPPEIGGKAARGDGVPTPAAAAKAAQKTIDKLEKQIEKLVGLVNNLNAAFPLIQSVNGRESNRKNHDEKLVKIEQLNGELLVARSELANANQRLQDAAAEKAAKAAAEAAAAAAKALAAAERAEAKAANDAVAAEKREAKAARAAADAAAAAEKEVAKEQARRERFFKDFSKVGDVNDEDYQSYKELQDGRKAYEEDMKKRYSEEYYNFWAGTEVEAEDQLRRQQDDRELAFEEWDRTRLTENFQLKKAELMVKAFTAQLKRIAKSVADLETAIDALRKDDTDAGRDQKLAAKLAQLTIANWNLANLSGPVQAQIDRAQEYVRMREGAAEERTRISKFTVAFAAVGVQVTDWPAYRNEKEKQERERKEFLKDNDNNNNLWLLQYGNRFAADDAVRKKPSGQGEGALYTKFGEWKDVKDELDDAIDLAERAELNKQINRLNNAVSSAKDALKKAQTEAGADAAATLSAAAKLRVVTRIAEGIVPQLEARRAALVAAASTDKAAARKAKTEAAAAARAAKKAAVEATRQAKQQAEEAEKEKREYLRLQKKAQREAAAAEAAAAKAAAKAKTAAEKAAADEAAKKAREANKASKQAAKDALKAAKEAVKKKREQEDQALYEKNLEEIRKETADTPSQLAAASLTLDMKRARLQERFNNEVGDEPRGDEPAQPVQGISSKPKSLCQVHLSDAQHMHLFLEEAEAFPDDDLKGDDESSAAGTPAPMVIEEYKLPDGASMEPEEEDDVPIPDAQGVQIGVPLTETELYTSDPLIFNRPYAKRLLKAHLVEMKAINEAAIETNNKAKFVNVWSSLGDDLDLAVAQLLPQWEQMLRYRNTMLKVKEQQLVLDLELIAALDQGAEGGEAEEGKESRRAKIRKNRVIRELNAVRKHRIKPQWALEARRMIEADRGQLPDQLYTPQPYYLPLRVSAPPRVGKSATALLMASLAKRAGMKTLYSVSPNKTTPIQEMQTKMIRIGWNSVAAASETDRTVRETFADYYKNSKCIKLEFAHFAIENVPGKSKAAPDYDKVDMILYSSDVPEDCQRAGAVLANWRYRDVVVFHIRDEAQSLAKALENSAAPAHTRDVPPPVELQYLRYYYGNLYGQNCNVTATHFPTFLEENMWGFIGSVRQNAAAGLSLSAGVRRVKSQLGSNFLPVLVPALLPNVSEGYMGIEYVETWQRFDESKQQMVDVKLEMGASHSAVDKNTGQIRNAAGKQEKRLTRQEERELARKAQEGKLEEEEKKKLKAAAKAAAKKSAKDVLASNSKKGGSSGASKKKPVDDDDYEPPSSDTDSQEEEEEENKQTGKRRRSKADKAVENAADRKKRDDAIKKDVESVQDHFKDFMTGDDARENDIVTWRSDAQRQQLYQKKIEEEGGDGMEVEARQTILVPMYLGALNTQISDTGMISFVRLFGGLAHNLAKADRFGLFKAKSKETSAGKAERLAAARKAYGVAFLLFTTALENREDVKDSEVKLTDDKATPGDPEPAELAKVGGEVKAQSGAPPPCEPAAEAKRMSALCFVYDPTNERNGRLQSGEEPFFDAFFVADADAGIAETWNVMGISKIGILGYGMLQAGLTVQSVIDKKGEPVRIYCPKYVALATAENAALDAQLQIAGRAFVELKQQVAPDNWRIKMLGVQGMVERLSRYSDMEKRLARIRGFRVFEALKDGFGASMMVTNSVGTLGVVGTQRGDFGSILGLTPEDAKKRAAVAKKIRDKRKGGAVDEQDEQDELDKQLNDADDEGDVGDDGDGGDAGDAGGEPRRASRGGTVDYSGQDGDAD